MDAQQLLWYGDLVKTNIEEFQFTRVVYGSGPSLLSSTPHLESM